MTIKSVFLYCAVLILSLPSTLIAQERIDWDAVTKIRDEGFNRSQVMELAQHITDVLGPRLSGSPSMRNAQQWALEQLDDWGLKNTNLEPWGEFGMGWSSDFVSLHMTKPQYMRVIGYPKAWTSGTDGWADGNLKIAPVRTREDLEKYRGSLHDAVVLTVPMREVEIGFMADAWRYSDEQLQEMSRFNPQIEQNNPSERDDDPQDLLSNSEIRDFSRSEGALALLDPGTRGNDGTVFVSSPRRISRSSENPRAIPEITLTPEHYNRLFRLVEMGTEVEFSLNLQNTFYTDDLQEYNVIGEIPGTDLAEELVMVGGHFDSWHSGTGATDNGAGTAVALEAVRILKAIEVQPRRTIRIALWSGEEQGLLGSRAYVANHFGTYSNQKSDYDKLSAYYQHDSGTGSIRGITIQMIPELIPVFTEWMRPFQDIGMKALTGHNSISRGGSDHVPYVQAGLNGFSFLQDRIQYSTKTHHSNMDVFDNLVEEDLMKNAVITASFLYHTAMRDELLPRRSIEE